MRYMRPQKEEEKRLGDLYDVELDETGNLRTILCRVERALSEGDIEKAIRKEIEEK